MKLNAIWKKLISWYLAPAQYLADRLCTGGPRGLPLLLLLLIFVPPVFWLSIFSIIVFLIGLAIGSL